MNRHALRLGWALAALMNLLAPTSAAVAHNAHAVATIRVKTLSVVWNLSMDLTLS